MNQRLAEKEIPALPESEKVAIALHLVNSGFGAGDLRETHQITEILSQLFDVVDSAYGITVDRSSTNAARFITHMRYLFVRMKENTQLNEGFSTLIDTLSQSHPEAVICGNRIADILELRLDKELSGAARHPAYHQ